VTEVILDSWLREFGPKGPQTTGPGGTVRTTLEELEARYPQLKNKLRDESGTLRKFVRVFVDGEDVSQSRGLDTPLDGVRTVHILHSIAGG
jgi:sulfur-carrier protein